MDSKAKQWSVEETNCLLAIWSSAEVQQKMEGASRTKHVFDEIQRDMAAAGFIRTREQINNKLKKLKMDYRDQKKELARSGNGRPSSRNPHFEVLDSILGDKPAFQITGALNSPTALLESMVDETLVQGIANNVTDSDNLKEEDISPTASSSTSYSTRKSSLPPSPSAPSQLCQPISQAQLPTRQSHLPATLLIPQSPSPVPRKARAIGKRKRESGQWETIAAMQEISRYEQDRADERAQDFAAREDSLHARTERQRETMIAQRERFQNGLLSVLGRLIDVLSTNQPQP
ncbi:hypothetical protein UPYG_G00313840 [Umbra pygmaea]|uniref:Myb/SANT-like DNA-binding domain-containing protein n=1 Tax=Umbra pygmaea TaxID=75934 RepID=A0ABD0WHT7_UMBPY